MQERLLSADIPFRIHFNSRTHEAEPRREGEEGEEEGEAFHCGRGRGLGGLARRGGVPPRRLRPGVAASPLAVVRFHGCFLVVLLSHVFPDARDEVNSPEPRNDLAEHTS